MQANSELASGENSKIAEKRKARAAFRTIGEVSSELDIPSHVLRFWEGKFTQIKPQKRRGGHRYYRQEDIEIIREVKALLHDRGYTIKGAQKHFKDLKKSANSNDNSQENSTENMAVAQNISGKSEGRLKEIIVQLQEVKSLLKSV